MSGPQPLSVTRAPEVAAADSNTDSATQSNTGEKKSKQSIQIILIQYDVLNNA